MRPDYLFVLHLFVGRINNQGTNSATFFFSVTDVMQERITARCSDVFVALDVPNGIKVDTRLHSLADPITQVIGGGVILP